jgi:hypothetical protein
VTYWDQGRQRARASDRMLVDEDGHPRRVIPLRQLTADHPDFPHGDTGWQYGCRCDICVPAHNTRMAEYRRRAGLTRPGPYIPKADRSARCGTRGGYNRHRRLGEEACAACRAANSKYQSAYARGLRLIDPAIEAAMRHGM